MENKILIKALQCYRKSKVDSLKNNQKYGRTICVELRKKQIAEIDSAIEAMEQKQLDKSWIQHLSV